VEAAGIEPAWHSHLVEQPGARRVVLPLSAVFLVLLLGITLIEAMTRIHMARPDGIPEELEPKRPARPLRAPDPHTGWVPEREAWHKRHTPRRLLSS
jgi:hypothetical protein